MAYVIADFRLATFLVASEHRAIHHVFSGLGLRI